MDGEFTGLSECADGLDQGHEFHAVVGGPAKAAGDFLPDLLVEQDSCVTTGAGISTACAVGKDGDRLGAFQLWWGLAFHGVTHDFLLHTCLVGGSAIFSG